MTNNLITFGKYKGQPVDVLQTDPQYVDWLMGQSWFAERHKNIYTVVINNFAEASETPEHNAMHVKFLSDDWRKKLSVCIENEWRMQYLMIDYKAFNKACQSGQSGWAAMNDSISSMIKMYKESLKNFALRESVLVAVEHYGFDAVVRIGAGSYYCEIKPAVGDDFPAVIRQINSNGERARVTRATGARLVLILGQYTGVGATFDQMVAMFSIAGIWVIRDEDITLVDLSDPSLSAIGLQEKCKKFIIEAYSKMVDVSKVFSLTGDQGGQLAEIEFLVFGEKNLLDSMMHEIGV